MRHGKIIGIGWNYRSHLAETNAELPKEPIVFLKPSSCLIGDGDDITIPEGVGEVHYEGELALIIGRTCKDVPESEASSCISHLAVFNDVTAREMQTDARNTGNPWSISKGMDTFGPMSVPVPVDGIDIMNLDIEVTVNGELKQKGNTSYMIFPPAKLISFVSKFMTIEEGDIIATGTPEGIGPIRKGDTVTVSINGVGSVTNPVV